MSKLLERKDYLEWLKDRLWKAYFKGRPNNKTMAQITDINKDLSVIYKTLYPRNARQTTAPTVNQKSSPRA